MPGQCPGECGRRIAGCDACPTQKGRHPPKRGTPALPLPACLLRFSVCIVPVRTAGRCDKNLSRFCPSPLNLPSGLPLPHDLPKADEAKQGAVRVRKRCREAGRTAQPPSEFSCAALEVSAVEPFPATAAHKGPHTAFQPCGGVRGATRPIGCTQALTRADTGPCFWFGARFTAIGKDNPVRKVSVSFLVFRHFWEPSVLL